MKIDISKNNQKNIKIIYNNKKIILLNRKISKKKLKNINKIKNKNINKIKKNNHIKFIIHNKK